MSNVAITVELAIKTCAKGHFYGVPYWMLPCDFACPMCKREWNKREEADHERLRRSERQARALVTRLRNRLKK